VPELAHRLKKSANAVRQNVTRAANACNDTGAPLRRA
jgi:hypothetical protein